MSSQNNPQVIQLDDKDHLVFYKAHTRVQLISETMNRLKTEMGAAQQALKEAQQGYNLVVQGLLIGKYGLVPQADKINIETGTITKGPAPAQPPAPPALASVPAAAPTPEDQKAAE